MKPIAYCRIVLLLLIISIPSFATGEDAPSLVGLSLNDCSSISSTEVERILRLELRSITAGQKNVTARPTEVKVTCAPDIISLQAVDSVTDHSRTRRIRMDENPPDGTERLIAIAATELVFSGWAGLANQSADPADNPGPKADSLKNNIASSGEQSTRTPQISPKSRLDAALQISALWRMYFSGKTNLFGGEIGSLLCFSGPFYLHLGIAPEGGRASRALGDVSLFSVSGAFSLGLRGAMFSSPLKGGADIGFRGGYGRLNGKPKSPSAKGSAVSGGFGGPFLRLSIASSTRLGIGVSVEGGYAAFGNSGRVGDDQSVEMKGPWLSVRLDFQYFFTDRNTARQ